MLISCESAAYPIPWEDVQKVTTAAEGEGQGFEGELKWEKEREVKFWRIPTILRRGGLIVVKFC